jgi:membrane-bound serine protease (ClpP class)
MTHRSHQDRSPRALPRAVLCALLLAVFAPAFSGHAFADQPSAGQPLAGQPLVDKLVLADTIQPVTSDELLRAVARAPSDGAQALLIELDTPGGLLDSTRTMAGAILSSRVPVIIYVSPAGARAGSAGFFLLESADIAAMAPGTNAGAAHPVLEFGGQPDATMSQKIENDTEAFLRSYVTRRGRNTDAAVAAVQSSHSYTAEEALSQHLIDLIANNDADLLAHLDGRDITRIDGSKTTLHLARATIAVIKPTLREQVLGWLVNPNIALLFLVCGALLIYLEFNSPGTIVPGALGTLMVLLAVFALDLLPIRYTAVLLLVAAFVLLILEAKIGGHGALAIAGIACLAFGMLTLIAAPVPELGVNPLIAISISAAFGAITVFLVRLAVRARKRKTRIGPDAMVGRAATAMEALGPEGHVLVEGEIWNATADAPIPAGAALRVVGRDHLLLRVEPASLPRTPGPRPSHPAA